MSAVYQNHVIKMCLRKTLTLQIGTETTLHTYTVHCYFRLILLILALAGDDKVCFLQVLLLFINHHKKTPHQSNNTFQLFNSWSEGSPTNEKTHTLTPNLVE